MYPHIFKIMFDTPIIISFLLPLSFYVFILLLLFISASLESIVSSLFSSSVSLFSRSPSFLHSLVTCALLLIVLDNDEHRRTNERKEEQTAERPDRAKWQRRLDQIDTIKRADRWTHTNGDEYCQVFLSDEVLVCKWALDAQNLYF